ncbi:hypothetical protein F5051DRAFT_445254 [Lentinula edodes]|nr:hypothetical protein F5051DRAFT_445254 [Lentinula edodes]
MSTSRTTTTTTQPTASSSSRPADPLRPGTLIDEDEDEILWEALARVERVKARKAAEAAKKKAAEEAAARKAEEERRKKEVAAKRKAAQEARDRASRAQQQDAELIERRRLLAEAATARSQRGTSPSEMLVSPRRPIVEIRREKGKGRARIPARPVGGDPDDGDNGNDDDDDDEEEREPCERCKANKIPCLQQAGKRSSVICKPCHDSKVRCSFSGQPSTVKREGGSGERIAVMESQMAQSLADLRALREANSKSHQYLRQLLRRQEDDHARLIAMETRMAMMGMGEGPAVAGPSSRRTKRRRPLKQRRIVEESAEEEEEEEEKEVEEKEAEVEKDGEGEEEEMEAEEEGEGEAPAPTTAKAVASEKGKEKEVVAPLVAFCPAFLYIQNNVIAFKLESEWAAKRRKK